MIKRYPCQAAILFILGILAAKGIAVSREAGAKSCGLALILLAVLAAGCAAGICIREESSGRKKLRQAVILLLAFGIGLLRMHAVSAMMERRLAALSDEQTVTVQGRIVKKQLRETSDQIRSWTVCLTDGYLKTSQEIRSCGDIIIYVDLKSDAPVIGNTILISGKTKLFREARNDGNFDERRYYQNQGYALKIYGNADSFRVMDGYTDRMREFLYKLKQKLVQVYQCSMPEEEAGVMCAMLLGERTLLPDAAKQLYQQSGIAHILAISGLHISILGAALFRLLRKRGVSYRIAASASMGLIALFGMMTGMGISTMRAVLMFGIYLGAACCGRAYDSMNGLAVSAICLLLQNPRCLFLAGFQFSFLAVAGVLLGKEICRVCRPRYRLAETVSMSLSIQMMTLPLTAWYYFEIPVYAILLNLFVLPFMGIVLFTGLIGGILGMPAACGLPVVDGLSSAGSLLSGGFSAVGGRFSEGLLTGCTLLLGYFSDMGKLFLRLPGAVSVIGRPEVWQMAGYYVLLAVCVCVIRKMQQSSSECGMAGRQNGAEGKTARQQMTTAKETVRQQTAAGKEADNRQSVTAKDAVYQKILAVTGPVRYQMVTGLGFVLCLSLLFLRLPDQAKAVFLDVGQGDGIYIRTSDGMNVMIDGGSTDVKQAGTYRILPFLKSQGIAGIDYWFLSHLDQDHISGFLEMAEEGYPVGEVVLSSAAVRDEAYEKMMYRLSEYQIRVRYLEDGDTLRGQNACFRCLAPITESAANDRNAGSLVLLYEDCGIRGFFPGDISKKEEQELLKNSQLTQVTLYKAAHHGSEHSNAKELLAQLQPVVSVISCAEDNDYGHPGKEAAANMEAYSSRVEYTMHSGQISILFHKKRVKIVEFIHGSGTRSSTALRK